ncbi:MAG: class A beta-lactamase-related serine hydrolase [Cytophagales bacterium]|nr:MAG: class A beta-lactamase-related serine hydrolase [Cytophagales bacterium]TAF60972.1 MAG: class A beta-lactamase-related serine hydrolase [Cytophagales bacterium]
MWVKILLVAFTVLILMVLGVLFYFKYKLNNVQDRQDLAASIAALSTKYVAEDKAYGLVVAVVKQNKTFVGTYGTTHRDKHQPPNAHTLFELASTSKLFTTCTLQLLADREQLALDEKIQSILEDRVRLPASAQTTTLRHLATHTAGFPPLPESFLAKMTEETNPYKDLKLSDLYEYLKNCKGKLSEGHFEYSNFGMGLLGHLLELKTGIHYEQLVKQTLLKELNMNQTVVNMDSSQLSQLAQGYNEKGQPTPVWIDPVLTGAGSFLSNATDMIQFIKANLQEDATDISKSLISTHAEQLGSGAGLGWMLPSTADKLMGNKSILWHNGMAGGYASFLVIDKLNNYGLVVLSNKAVDVTDLGLRLSLLTRTQSWKPL